MLSPAYVGCYFTRWFLRVTLCIGGDCSLYLYASFIRSLSLNNWCFRIICPLPSLHVPSANMTQAAACGGLGGPRVGQSVAPSLRLPAHRHGSRKPAAPRRGRHVRTRTSEPHACRPFPSLTIPPPFPFLPFSPGTSQTTRPFSTFTASQGSCHGPLSTCPKWKFCGYR
jgi:hypothetical protein